MKATQLGRTYRKQAQCYTCVPASSAASRSHQLGSDGGAGVDGGGADGGADGGGAVPDRTDAEMTPSTGHNWDTLSSLAGDLANCPCIVG